MKLDKSRVAGSLKGLLVGDAIAVPGHWFYSPTKLRADYGEIDSMVAPKKTHAESMVQGMSYTGSIDIMHDKARFYKGNKLADDAAAAALSESDIEARRDDHGNYVGALPQDRVHYHATLKKGQNTTNACIARLLMRHLGKRNANQQDYYNPDIFLEEFHKYMTTPPSPNDDSDQIESHHDVYMDVYLRGFFTRASAGLPLRACALSQRDTWSIGSLDGIVMSIPMIAAYSYEPESVVTARAIEHHMLTHRSVTVTASIVALVPIFCRLYRGADLKTTLDEAMEKMRPPKMTGRQMRDSYVQNHGPGNIPKHEKWLQHMILDESETTKDLVHRMLDYEDEDVAGFGERENSRLATACYCEQGLTVVLYLAYKYGTDNPRKALLQNVMIGGHSTSRGAILGAILGAAHPDEFPFFQDMCAREAITREVENLVSTLPSQE